MWLTYLFTNSNEKGKCQSTKTFAHIAHKYVCSWWINKNCMTVTSAITYMWSSQVQAPSINSMTWCIRGYLMCMFLCILWQWSVLLLNWICTVWETFPFSNNRKQVASSTYRCIDCTWNSQNVWPYFKATHPILEFGSCVSYIHYVRNRVDVYTGVSCGFCVLRTYYLQQVYRLHMEQPLENTPIHSHIHWQMPSGSFILILWFLFKIIINLIHWSIVYRSIVPSLTYWAYFPLKILIQKTEVTILTTWNTWIPWVNGSLDWFRHIP